MTNELIALAERLERHNPWKMKDEAMWRGSESRYIHPLLEEAAAMLRKMAEQKPVAWCNLDLWNDGGYEAQDCFVDKPGLTCFDTPLYAAPVAAITAEQEPAQPVKRIMLMRLRAGGLWTQITEEYPHPYDDYEYAWATIERLDQNAVSA